MRIHKIIGESESVILPFDKQYCPSEIKLHSEIRCLPINGIPMTTRCLHVEFSGHTEHHRRHSSTFDNPILTMCSVFFSLFTLAATENVLPDTLYCLCIVFNNESRYLQIDIVNLESVSQRYRKHNKQSNTIYQDHSVGSGIHTTSKRPR